MFKDFNLVIPSSQKVGIVGLSGAGKTTLCQLLLRNYDIDSGAIIVGGQDIAKVVPRGLAGVGHGLYEVGHRRLLNVKVD